MEYDHSAQVQHPLNGKRQDLEKKKEKDHLMKYQNNVEMLKNIR
jgi:hypothetical protein